MSTPVALADDVHAQVTALSAEGDTLAAEGDFAGAKLRYVSALQLLPGDPRQWTAATWLYVALGDALFHTRDFERVFMAFSNAVQCPGGLGNPYIHLRLGQAQFERGELTRAADELTRAYMGGGLEIFMEDDPKYLAFLETKIAI